MEKVDLRNTDFFSNKKEGVLRDKIRFLEDQKRDAELYNQKGMIPDLEKELRYTKRVLEANTPPKITSRDKDKLYKQKKELEEKLATYRLTEKENWSNDPIDRQRAVKKCLYYMDNMENTALRLKKINRILEPQNDEIQNLDYVLHRSISG